MLPQIAPSLQPIILNILLSSFADENSTVESGHDVPFELKDVPGKGKAAIAIHPIERGDVVLSERAMLVWPQGLTRQEAEDLFSTLSPQAKEAFLSLSNARPNDETLGEILSIRGTNSFNVELPSVEEETAMPTESPSHASFTFPRISRINHSCLSSADQALDWSSLIMTVYAVTDIKAGEEVTIEYTSGLLQKKRAVRQALLEETFGFLCSCSCCTLTGEAQEASDARRHEIDSIVQRVASGEASRPEVLQLFERLHKLLEEEGYKAMPEFDEPGVSKAFSLYMRMHAQNMAEAETEIAT